MHENPSTLRQLGSLITLVLVSFLFSPPDVEAQKGRLVQRFRMIPGKYKIAGNAPTRIPVACIDKKFDPPTPSHFYTRVAGDVVVGRYENNVLKAALPYEKAIAEKWIKGFGNGTWWELEYQAVKPLPNVHYELHVKDKNDPPIVGLDDAADLGGARKTVISTQKYLDAVDSYIAEVDKQFGTDSQLAPKLFHKSRTQFGWEITKYLKEKDVTDADIVEDFKDYLATQVPRLSPDDQLTYFTLVNGKELTKKQIGVLREFSGVANAYKDSSLPPLERYAKNTKLLADAFGDSSPKVKYYESDVAGRFVTSKNLDASLSYARKMLVPDQHLRSSRHLADFLALTSGERLTKGQIQALSSLLEREVNPPSGLLDRHLYIQVGGNTVEISTTTTRNRYQLDEFTPRILRDLVATHPHVVINGEITDRLVSLLREAEVRFVRAANWQFFRNPTFDDRPLHFVIVASQDSTAINRQLFETTDASVRRGVEVAQTIPMDQKTFVTSAQELDAALVRARDANQRVILIFHHGSDGIMFPNEEERLTLDRLSFLCEFHRYDVIPISCNTYDYDRVGFVSVDRIDFDVTMRAIVQARQIKPKNSSQTDAFLNGLVEQYGREAAKASRDRRVKTGVFLVGGLGIAGPAIGGILASVTPTPIKKDDDEKKKEEQK